MARWDSGLESETATTSGEGHRLTGPEFEVEVKPRRCPDGADLNEAVADYEDQDGGKPGRGRT